MYLPAYPGVRFEGRVQVAWIRQRVDCQLAIKQWLPGGEVVLQQVVLGATLMHVTAVIHAACTGVVIRLLSRQNHRFAHAEAPSRAKGSMSRKQIGRWAGRADRSFKARSRLEER